MKYLSALLTQASGKLGGAVAAKNRGGNYFRARVAPVQPRSVAQQNVRSNLATQAAIWKGLTQANISAWNALASLTTLSDSLGNSYKPSGIDLFVALNTNLADNGLTPITTAPAAVPSYPNFGPITATASAAGGTLAIIPGSAAAPTGYVYLVRATPQLSPGVSYIGKSKYRTLTTFAATAFASLAAGTAYVAKFGTMGLGRKIGIHVALLQTTTGFKTLAQAVVVVVTT